jgi:hypothetical protein
MPGGRGRGYRWMYLQTGLPGWARYGYPSMPWSHISIYFPYLLRAWDFPAFRAPVLSRDEELSALREEAAAMEEELKEIKKRIQELEG